MKKFLKTAFVVFLSILIFFVSSYSYLSYNLKKSEKEADKKEDDIPYFDIPENCGVLIELPSGNSVLFFLDFEKEVLYIIDIYTYVTESDDYVGYPIDFKCDMDYYTLSLFFDRIGGIDLEREDGFCRLNGIQICDLLAEELSDGLSYRIVCAVCERISETGLTANDFVFLTENCDTDLNMPVCLYWCDYMKTMFANAVFVNREN